MAQTEAKTKLPHQNLELWNRVKATDPKYTKRTNNRRYDFTCIDPQYQLQKATELWGPYGWAWGLRDLNWQTIDTGGGVLMMMLSAEFFCPNPDGDDEVTFEIAVDMKLKAGDDVCKKLMTSARSKALSYLGFSADVFMGQFEDEQYLKQAKVKFGDRDQFLKRALGQIKSTKETNKLRDIREKVEEMIGLETISLEDGQHLLDVLEVREAELLSDQLTS